MLQKVDAPAHGYSSGRSPRTQNGGQIGCTAVLDKLQLADDLPRGGNGQEYDGVPGIDSDALREKPNLVPNEPSVQVAHYLRAVEGKQERGEYMEARRLWQGLLRKAQNALDLSKYASTKFRAAARHWHPHADAVHEKNGAFGQFAA